MGKVNNPSVYPVTTPVLLDRLIGTDRSNTTNDSNGETVQFEFTDILALFQSEMQTAGVNATPIGNTVASTGAFTSVSASSGFTGNLSGNVTGNVTGNANGNHTGTFNGRVGNSSPNTGEFTTVNASGSITAGNFLNVSNDIRFYDGATKIASIDRVTASGSINIECDVDSVLANSFFAVDVDNDRYIKCTGGFVKLGGNHSDTTNGTVSGTGKNQFWIKTNTTASPVGDWVGDSIFARINRSGSSNGEILQFRRNGTNVGSIDVTTTATSYNTSSDKRLKQHIRPLDSALTLLSALKPSKFEFRRDPDTTHLGFIAQDLLPIVPTAVSGADRDTDEDGNIAYMSVDLSKLVPILTAALQETVALAHDLEARIEALEGA